MACAVSCSLGGLALSRMGGTGPLTVLVVDDDHMVRTAVAHYLRRRGCRVTTAADGVEALELLRSASVDLVVTDLEMPRSDGLALWREATSLRPDLRGHFLFTSAAAAPDALAEISKGERFLPKPFRLGELWREVSALARK